MLLLCINYTHTIHHRAEYPRLILSVVGISEYGGCFSFCLLPFCPSFVHILTCSSPDSLVSNTPDTNTKYLHQMMQLQAAAHTNKEHAAYCILRCTNILHYSVLLKIHSAFFISFQQNINFSAFIAGEGLIWIKKSSEIGFCQWWWWIMWGLNTKSWCKVLISR